MRSHPGKTRQADHGHWRTAHGEYSHAAGAAAERGQSRLAEALADDELRPPARPGPANERVTIAHLAELLDVPSSAAGFANALGFAIKPARVRMRFDPALFGMPAHITEASLRVDEITGMAATPARALIIENEITYLSVPIPPGGVVLFGKGYDASVPASLTWLADADVAYRGDIDTHGFRILDRVRAPVPHARSLLMDRGTLIRHEERWGTEETATSAHLTRLTPDEKRLYEDLVSDHYAPRLRREQERIDWQWVEQALAS